MLLPHMTKDLPGLYKPLVILGVPSKIYKCIVLSESVFQSAILIQGFEWVITMVPYTTYRIQSTNT